MPSTRFSWAPNTWDLQARRFCRVVCALPRRFPYHTGLRSEETDGQRSEGATRPEDETVEVRLWIGGRRELIQEHP